MGHILLKYLLQFILLTITVFIFFIGAFLILAVLALLYPYKLLVFCIARLRMPHLIEFVYGESGAMAVDPLYTQPNYNLLYFFVLDGVIPFQRFIQIFQERIINKTVISGENLVYGRFQQFWVNFMGYHFWGWDMNFKIENHINFSTEFYTKNDLPKLMSHLMPKPFKEGQSPWEIVLLYNYHESNGADSVQNGPKKMVAVLKIHHALADGFSLLNVFQRDLPCKTTPLQIPQGSSAGHSFWKKCFWIPLTLWQYSNYVIESYDSRNSWIFPVGLRNNGKTTGQAYYTSITSGIEVSKVSAIKKKYGVSYFSVLIHCLFKGVRVAMERDGQNVPDKTGFIFTTNKPNHPGGLSNHMYITMTTVPMEESSSAQSRLKEIEGKLIEEKDSLKPIAIDGFVQLISCLPVPLISLLTGVFHPHGFACSNFPVPKDETVIEGCRMTDLFVGLGSMVPQRTATVMACGTGGRQSLVVCVDESSYSSHEAFEKLGDYIQDELNYLMAS